MEINLKQAGTIIAIALGLLFGFLLIAKGNYSKAIPDFEEWLKNNQVVGAGLFLLIQAASACFILPVTAWEVLAGAVFKPFIWSVIMSLAGNQIGIIISYHIGRFFLRPWVESRIQSDPKLKALDRSLGLHGFKIICLVRLTPIFPFGMSNYVFSASENPLSRICIASLLGNIPNVVIHCLIGNLAGSDYRNTPPRFVKLSILLTLTFAIVTTTFITIIAKKALFAAVEADNQSFATEEEQVNTVEEQGLVSVESSVDCSFIVSDEAHLLTGNASLDENYSDQELLILKVTAGAGFLVLLIGIPSIFLL